jgi:hypothetical protein
MAPKEPGALPQKTKAPRRISVAGIGDAGSKTNSMETGIIDPGYSTNKNAQPDASSWAL